MSERINNSLVQRREQGKPHAGGKRQFGFKEGSYFKELDEGEAKLIREGYLMLMDRNAKSPGDVARYSERTGGIVTYKGQDIGDSIYGAPLTREQWGNVQTLLDGRATPAAQGSGKRKHVYSGFLRCGYCGSAMRVQWATIQGRTFRRTFCHSAQRGRNGQLGCGKVSRKYEWIEDRLNEVVEAALLSRMPQEEEAQMEDLTSQISLLESRVRALRGRWKEGQMEDEDYFDSLTHLRAELEVLRTREAAATIRRSRVETDVLSVWKDGAPENLERRRAIVASVIDHVEVFSIGRGRRKPPEITSIKITPVDEEI